jgi:hypothetical protein
LSIIQGPFSVAPCQTLISRFATFSSPYVGVCAAQFPWALDAIVPPALALFAALAAAPPPDDKHALATKAAAPGALLELVRALF